VREEELPALRAETERKIDDVRTETRGWATIAVQTANKLDVATEFIKLVYKDVRETKETVSRIEGRLGGIDTRFDGIDGRLGGIDTRFDGVEGTLAAHGKILQQILAKLS
jgi:hypothetical protein